jgi:hypothetical protein
MWLERSALKLALGHSDNRGVSENRSILVAASLFVLCAICGALYLSRSSATSAPSSTPQTATPESRYLATMGEITAREQQAWLPAMNGFQNISDTYDDTWATAHDAANHGIPIIKSAITTLNQQQPPHQFQQAQALLLHKFQLELTLTGYIKAMTTKHGLNAIVRLFGPVGKIGKANKLITPRIVRAIGSAATASHLPPPNWATTIK